MKRLLTFSTLLVALIALHAEPDVPPFRSVQVLSGGNLRPAFTNFFVINSNLLNKAILHPDEGGGGSTNEITNAVTSIALTAPSSLFLNPVPGSPITSNGTIALQLNNQAAGSVFAGPASGASAAPSFRSLLASDVPTLSVYRGQGLENGDAGIPQVVWYTGGTADWEDLASAQVMILAHKQGRINLRGIICGIGGWRALSGTNYINDASIEAVATLMDYYKLSPGEVPMGLYTNTTWGFLAIYTNLVTNASYTIRTPKYTAWYVTNKAFGKFTSNPYYETSLRTFRRVLADAQTNSIHFAINHPIAPITQLLDSPADEFSPLTGEQLFLSRVRQISIMAGDYPTNYVQNGEYNISTSTGTAFSNVVARIRSKPITWIGFSIGAPPAPTEPVHIKSMSQGWRLLSTANPMYDLTYQATQTGDAGRAAWGGIHALAIIYGRNMYDTTTNIEYTWYSNVFLTNTMVLRTNDPGGDLDIMTYLGIPTTANYTNVGVVQNVQNITSNLFGFVTLGTNRIEASGTNRWWNDGINSNQRYLSWINTNLAQRLLNEYNYNTDYDPKPEKFDNSRTINLGIGTATPEKRVHMQFPNASMGFWGDNNYAKWRFGLNLSTDYAEIASQGQDTLYSAGSKTNSGVPQPGSFEFYRRTFDVGGPGLIARSSTNGGWWFGGFPSDLLERPNLGEVYIAAKAVTPRAILTNFVSGNWLDISETNILRNGVSILPIAGGFPTTSAELDSQINDDSGNGALLFANNNTQDSPTFTTKTVELGYKQVATLENNPNLNFAYQLSSISTNANFNITVQNATSNVIHYATYTNTDSAWKTGTLSTTFTVSGGAIGVTATAIALAPTNITHVKYWTDRHTNYFMQYESGIPNLPLDSIAGETFSAGETIRWDPVLGFTNAAVSGSGTVTSVSTDTNMSVATATTTPAITLTNVVGTGALVKQTNGSVSALTLNGTTTSAGHVLFSTDNTHNIGGDGVNRPAYVIAGTQMTAPLLSAQILLATNGLRFATNYFGASNTNAIYMTNASQWYVATTNFSITNVFETSALDTRIANLIVSNSATYSITGFIVVATARRIGSGTTDALVIPATKVGEITFKTFARYTTNYVTGVQQ